MFHFKNIKYKNILDIKELHIPKFKITCILGESGGGKTTLLRLFNKLISPDAGEILFDGQDLKHIKSVDLRRKVIMLPQTPAIFSGNIKDNLLIGLKFAEKPPVSDDKLLEVLSLVYLKKDLNEVVDKLSGGEKQRLALGRALLIDPEVFLLDEPSSALDEDTEHILIEKLADFSRKNSKTLIIVTHSKKLANTFGDYIVKINSGKVVKEV
ncbi:ATP-binding cassette domain-containing protein [Clostridium sp. DJ247]|uniref:ABC transporter ATP-binding protein n=1 Tax=Clostridium sp. DJ247 TaxID=2726188 RepID=UPI001629091F|nr:ATP-binding cassette domain-containing protein [Clostridium sp. DJ247]MBC2579348.1 ATP-binding cassette domain-containing protein [Clostridium sp. DJ247]